MRVVVVVAACSLGLAHALTLACLPQATGAFALCCTCLGQRSPIGGDAVDDTTNCLPDDTEVDGCNDEAAALLNDPNGADPIRVVDEQCTNAPGVCDEECAEAKTNGARFEIDEASLSQ